MTRVVEHGGAAEGGKGNRPEGGQSNRPEGGKGNRSEGGQSNRPEGGKGNRPESGQGGRPVSGRGNGSAGGHRNVAAGDRAGRLAGNRGTGPGGNAERGFEGSVKVRVLRSLPARLRGMLGKPPSSDLSLISPCRDIHTFGMAYPIDVAFIDGAGRVVGSYRNVEPRCRIRCAAAAAVVERAANADKKWFVSGQYAGKQIQGKLRNI